MKITKHWYSMKISLLIAVFFIVFSLSNALPSSQKNEAVQFLENYEREYKPYFHQLFEIAWTYSTNITDHNLQEYTKALVSYDKKMKDFREEASKIDLSDANEDTKRQFRSILTTIQVSSNQTVAKRVRKVQTEMKTVYSTGDIHYDKNIIKSIKVKEGVEKLRLKKYLQPLMANSNDTNELKHVWKAWRDSVGPKVRDLYTEFVQLSNIGAREHGYKDAGHFKRSVYDVENLEELADSFLKDMRPFYLEIHGYVRYRLSKVYPNEVTPDGPIPAHLLGNMWAQNWMNIFKYVVPYPGEKSPDYTSLMKKKLTVQSMFEMAEEFFVSLGWPKLPSNFWTNSMFVEPKDRTARCHASAWDFHDVDADTNEPDVRVKMCTDVTQDDFNTVHHELGHIYYYLLYWNQPIEYRTGANPGFHEAVGDALVLSVQTPNHLKKVGLLDEVSDTDEADINFLMKTALKRIAFLPFGFLMDKWVWGVYSGDIKATEYNTKWWEYRLKYQGIKPPVERSENDFDPGAKYHIPANVPYIRYFFSYILQFVFHKQSCHFAGHKGPLHKCSMYNSKEAGRKFKEMLSLGRSKPWPEILKQFTGSEKISTDAIKEYFNPLITWLRKYRMEKNYKLDWNNE